MNRQLFVSYCRFNGIVFSESTIILPIQNFKHKKHPSITENRVISLLPSVFVLKRVKTYSE